MIKLQKPETKKEWLYAVISVVTAIGFVLSFFAEVPIVQAVGIVVCGAAFLYFFTNAFMNVKQHEKW